MKLIGVCFFLLVSGTTIFAQDTYELNDRGAMPLCEGRIVTLGYHRGLYKSRIGFPAVGTVVHVGATDCEPFKIGPKSIFHFQGRYFEVVSISPTIEKEKIRGELIFRELPGRPSKGYIANLKKGKR